MSTDLQEQFSLFVRGGEGIEVSNLGTVLRAVGLNPTQATVELHERNFQGSFSLCLVLGIDIFLGRGTISFEAFLPVYNSVKAKKDDGSEEDFIEGTVFFFLGTRFVTWLGLRVFDKEGNGQISVAGWLLTWHSV